MNDIARNHHRVGIVVGLLCTLCALSGADEPRSGREGVEQARQRVEKMSAGERDRIRKNFQAFRALPVERQEQLLTLHAEVQSDPKLQDVMQRYYEWFVTLEAGQQDDLRNAKGVNQKVSRVKEFRKAQADERSSHDLAEFGPIAKQARQLPTLTEKQLDEVMAIFEGTLPENTLKSEEKAKLASLTGAPRQRQSQILSYVVDREIEKDRRSNSPQPLSADLVKKLNDIPGPRLVSPLPQGVPEMPWMPKMRLFTVVAKSLDEQLKSPPPTQSALEKLFSQELNGTERDEIMRLRPEEGQRKLEEQYRELHPELYPLDVMRRYPQLLRRFQQTRPREFRPAPGDQGPDRKGGGPFRLQNGNLRPGSAK